MSATTITNTAAIDELTKFATALAECIAERRDAVARAAEARAEHSELDPDAWEEMEEEQEAEEAYFAATRAADDLLAAMERIAGGRVRIHEPSFHDAGGAQGWVPTWGDDHDALVRVTFLRDFVHPYPYSVEVDHAAIAAFVEEAAVDAIGRLRWAVKTAIERADARVRRLADDYGNHDHDYDDFGGAAQDAVLAALADVPTVNLAVPGDVLWPDAAGADRVAYATTLPGVRVVVTYDRGGLTAEIDVDEAVLEDAFEGGEDD